MCYCIQMPRPAEPLRYYCALNHNGLMANWIRLNGDTTLRTLRTLGTFAAVKRPQLRLLKIFLYEIVIELNLMAYFACHNARMGVWAGVCGGVAGRAGCANFLICFKCTSPTKKSRKVCAIFILFSPPEWPLCIWLSNCQLIRRTWCEFSVTKLDNQREALLKSLVVLSKFSFQILNRIHWQV